MAEKESSEEIPETQFLAQPTKMSLNPSDEIRYVEREHFDKISKMHLDYGERISNLKEKNQQQSFKIERLEDKIGDLKEKHVTELTAANKTATKEVVQTISAMPAAQSMLGMLATSFMSKSGGALAGVETGFSEQEKQIIEQVRRMQAEPQGHLINMLYFLFKKTNEEQMQIFTSLQAFMVNTGEEEEDI
jgi:hypothetical protein